MNRWCLALFAISLVVVVLGAPKKSFEENLKLLRKIDLDTVIKNDRIMKNYIDCVVGTKRCTNEGTALKESWKEGIDRGCDECDEIEKRKVKKIVKHLYVNKREWYDLLTNTLDKDHKYQDKYDKYIKEIIDDPTL